MSQRVLSEKTNHATRSLHIPSPPRWASGQVPTRQERPAGFSKFRQQHVVTAVHDWGSQDWLASMLCVCSSWGQSFTQTKHSIPNLRIYLCSIINYRNSRATQSFQRHVCLTGELGGPWKEMIKTQAACKHMIMLVKFEEPSVLPLERMCTQC